MTKRLEILNDLKLLTDKMFYFSSKLPKEQKYILNQQLLKAVISTRLNIREGNIFWNENKIRFFKIALGSLEEVDECVLILLEQNFISSKDYEEYKKLYNLCSNKLKKLIRSLSHLVNMSKSK